MKIRIQTVINGKLKKGGEREKEAEQREKIERNTSTRGYLPILLLPARETSEGLRPHPLKHLRVIGSLPDRSCFCSQ
jgi:hypothetical protein